MAGAHKKFCGEEAHRIVNALRLLLICYLLVMHNRSFSPGNCYENHSPYLRQLPIIEARIIT